MDVIISFDSEDYLTPEAADAEKWWADELTGRGIRGTFQCVAEMIRSLQRRGRQDVIDAIARHDIGQHTDFHSRPPTHPQAIEGMSLGDGVRYVQRTEKPAFDTLRETFGQTPISYCSPGGSWTPATLIAMASAGVGIFCNDSLPYKPAAPYWYCGLLVCAYRACFDEFFAPTPGQEEAFRQRYEKVAATIGEQGVMVVYSHPTRLVTADFWDRVFYGAKDTPIDQLPAAPLWPATHVQALKDRCRRWLDWIQARPGTRFIDFRTLYQRYSASPQRRDLPALLAECGLRPGQEAELPLDRRADDRALPAAAFADLRYEWPPLPEGFRGEALLHQARQLRWTSSFAEPHEEEPQISRMKTQMAQID